ncbi:MAG: pyridoxamine 5'-phosphate oxidase family protein [Candidatus Aenigmarchaeota archaeon]|nr:pyridoxamine 5'-phosphate oxidase family protein [Candidatus Aenigmarchaeota archaeon]
MIMHDVMTDEIRNFFESVPIIAFSMTDNNGNPNVVAIASKRIVDSDTIWVIDTFFGKTKENLLQNERVAIAVWVKGKGYQIKGTARYHSDGKIFDEGKKWILESRPNKIVKGVAEIKVSEIFSITPTYEEAGKKIA